jgi:hypothetical protein
MSASASSAQARAIFALNITSSVVSVVLGVVVLVQPSILMRVKEVKDAENNEAIVRGGSPTVAGQDGGEGGKPCEEGVIDFAYFYGGSQKTGGGRVEGIVEMADNPIQRALTMMMVNGGVCSNSVKARSGAGDGDADKDPGVTRNSNSNENNGDKEAEGEEEGEEDDEGIDFADERESESIRNSFNPMMMNDSQMTMSTEP